MNRWSWEKGKVSEAEASPWRFLMQGDFQLNLEVWGTVGLLEEFHILFIVCTSHNSAVFVRNIIFSQVSV